MNLAFLEELAALKDNNEALKAKVAEVAGKEVNIKPYTPKENPKAEKRPNPMAKVSLEEAIVMVNENGPVIVETKKKKATSQKKTTTTTPKESPADKFCKALIKLAGKYKESKPLSQYIGVQSDKQVWTNAHIAIKMVQAYKALESIQCPADGKYYDVTKVMQSAYKPEGETLEMTRTEITELTKGKEATDVVELAGAKLVVSTLRQLNALFPKITFYVATKPNVPVSFVTDFCEGLVTPARSK